MNMWILSAKERCKGTRTSKHGNATIAEGTQRETTNDPATRRAMHVPAVLVCLTMHPHAPLLARSPASRRLLHQVGVCDISAPLRFRPNLARACAPNRDSTEH